MKRYRISRAIHYWGIVITVSFLLVSPLFSDSPYYFQYSQDGTMRIIGKLELWPTYAAPSYSFSIDSNGNITKVGAIAASSQITAPYLCATSSFTIGTSMLVNDNGAWIYSPIYLSRTLNTPYGISCSTLQITNGAAAGYVATSDAYGNITLKPLQETNDSEPRFFQSAIFAGSLSKYGNGTLYIYTIGDDLATDASNFYLNTNKMKVSCDDSYSMYIGSGATTNTVANSIKLDMDTTVRGTMSATTFYGSGSGLTDLPSGVTAGSTTTWTAPQTFTKLMTVSSNVVINSVEISSSTFIRHASFVVKLATSTDDFCFFKPKYRSVSIVAFEAIISTFSGVASSWTGKLQKTDKNGLNPTDISWSNYVVISSIEYSTDTFRSNGDLDSNQRLKLETISTSGSVDMLSVDVWYRER